MLEEVTYCQEIKKKHFNQNMFLTKEDKQDFKMLINVIFVAKNILKKIFGFVIIAM